LSDIFSQSVPATTSTETAAPDLPAANDMPPTDVPPSGPSPRPGRGMARRVLEGTLLYGLGQSLPQLVRMLLMMFVFLKILRPADYGLIELANIFGAFVQTFMRMGVPGAVTRFYFEHAEGEPLRNYVTTIAWFLLICSLVVGGLAALLWPLASVWLPGMPFYPLAFMTIVGGVVYANMELQNRLVQAREQAGYQMRLNLLRATVSIALALILVVGFRLADLGLGALGMIAAEVASFGVLGLIAAWYLRPDLRGQFKKELIGDSLKYGAAQIPGDFVNTLVPLITRGFLSSVVSMAALGLLAVAVRFTQPLTILINAFKTAYEPIYYSVRKEATADGLRRLAAAARSVWMVAVLCALSAALLGPPLIVLLIPKDYSAASSLLPILTVGFLGQAAFSVMGPEIYYSKKTWLVPAIVYTSAGADVLISLLTAKQYGPVGVAWGLSTRMVVTAVLATFFSLRLVTIPHAWFSYLRIAVCGLLSTAVYCIRPSHSPLADLTWGLLAVAIYPALLLASGDPTVREAAGFIRRVFERLSGSTAAG
jgi:O-antigen/teichoic acid export membrane protein